MGRSTIDYPNVVIIDGSVAFKKAFWAHSQYMKKIWDKWMKEDLLQLTKRKKWDTEEKKLMEVGDFVWVCDKQCHTFNYRMRRILEIHTGDDGVFRSTTVRTN